MYSIKKVFGIVSPILLFMVIQYVVAFFAAYLFMSSSFLLETELSEAQTVAMAETMFEVLVENIVLISGIASVISIPIFYLKLNKEWLKRSYRIQTTQPAYVKYLWVALMSVGLTLAVNLAVNEFALLSYDNAYAEAAVNLYTEPLYLQILVIGFLMPVSEELMFRGLVYERSKNLFGMRRGVLLASFLFGFYHGTVTQMIYGFVFSLLMIYAYERCGSFLAPVCFHVVSNLAGLILSQIPPLSTIGYSIGIVAFALIGLFGFQQIKKGDFYQVISLDNPLE